MFDRDRLLPLGAVGVVVLFLFAVLLLGTATDAVVRRAPAPVTVVR